MRTKQTPKMIKARKARKTPQPSDATIARREKKAAVALEQLGALEKHNDERAELQSQGPVFDMAAEVKVLRGMVGKCLAQLAELDKVVVGV